VCRLAEISYDHTQEDSHRKARVKIGRGSKIRRHYSATDQDIFAKFVPQRVKWSKYVSFKHPGWQTAAIFNWLYRYNSAADCPILLKFCTTSNMYVPRTTPLRGAPPLWYKRFSPALTSQDRRVAAKIIFSLPYQAGSHIHG